jgi:hypothetical protein
MSTEIENFGFKVAASNITELDTSKYHQFELMEVRRLENVQTKFGVKNQIRMTFKEAGKERDFHRVWLTFNESNFEKSNLVRFMSQISGKPIQAGTEVRSGDYLRMGMKVLALVKPRIRNGEKSGYYDFIMESVKPVV